MKNCRVFQKFIPVFSSLKVHWLLKMPFIKQSMLFIIHLTLNNWNVSNQNVLLNFFRTFSKWWGIECTSSQSVLFFQAKRSHCLSSSSVLGARSLYFGTSTIIQMVSTCVCRPVVLCYKVCKSFWHNVCMKCAPPFSLQGFPTFVGHISPCRCARNSNIVKLKFFNLSVL